MERVPVYIPLLIPLKLNSHWLTQFPPPSNKDDFRQQFLLPPTFE